MAIYKINNMASLVRGAVFQLIKAVVMGRHTNGWVKDYRKQIDSDIFDNPYLAAIWGFLKLAAIRNESKILWDGEQRVLVPGSVIMGLKELADRWLCSRKTIHKWLHYLESTGRISLETGTRGCLITILNWEGYQGSDDDEVTTREHGGNAEVTPSKRQVALNREVQEVKKERIKEERDTSPEFLFGEIWNLHCGELPKINGLSKSRRRLVTEKLKEKPDLKYWEDLVKRMAKSPFCLGKQNGPKNPNWKATFDFLISSDTHLKISEGQYGCAPVAQPKSATVQVIKPVCKLCNGDGMRYLGTDVLTASPCECTRSRAS